MKTQIITLESHDDLISVRDRLSWAKTPRILLVWPKYENVSLRALDLKVLQRHADSLGAQLGLVTRRASVKREAEALGIPVFKTATSAQKEAWPERAFKNLHPVRPPRRDLRTLRDSVQVKEGKWRAAPLARVVVFSVGVLAVLTMAGLFVPRAAVTLYPQMQTQSIVIPVTASESTRSVSLTGNIPAQSIKTVVEEKQVSPVSSRIDIAENKAHGVAHFTNLTVSDVAIPAGTIVQTADSPPVQFVTAHETILLAGAGKFVEAPMEAVAAGAQANLKANAIQTVAGPLGLLIAVTNPAPTTGGTDRSAVGPSDSDLTVARTALLKKLGSDAQAQMQSQIPPGDLLMSATLTQTQILDETHNPQVGQAGTSLTVSMRVEYSAQYVRKDDLHSLAEATLNASLPLGYAPVAGSLTIDQDPAPVVDASGVHWQMKTDRNLLRNVDVIRALELARGLSPASARQQLQSNISMRQPPKIDLSPSWWPWMPLIPFRIMVTTQ